jgi:carbamoyltransferase
LILDGIIIAAAQEERFTRKKADNEFPFHAIQFCLNFAGVAIGDLDAVVFYDLPDLKFDRILRSQIMNAPRELRSFSEVMPHWLCTKLDLHHELLKNLKLLAVDEITQMPEIHFTTHHCSHAAAAFYPSPFEEAAVLCLDGVGEWVTTSVWHGRSNKLTPLWELHYPDSIGLLYSAFTFYRGFKVNSGEYKLMGLAPYGSPVYAEVIKDNLIDIKPDGTFRLNMKYFDYDHGHEMINANFEQLLGRPARRPETTLDQFDMDIASSIQLVIEEVIMKLADTVYRELGVRYLCMAGGVALNCVANGRLLANSSFEDIWIQPAAGDAGSAVGAAYCYWYSHLEKTRKPNYPDAMQGCYLGPEFDNSAIQHFLDTVEAEYEYIDDALLSIKAAELLNGEDNVLGWFQGRSEFGPRALGNRSILADPRSSKIQSILNQKIKFRESFRPFAPAVLEDYSEEYFNLSKPSPYMLFVTELEESKKIHCDEEEAAFTGVEKLKSRRSVLPAITHVDYSARIQTVSKTSNPKFYSLIEAFRQLTGCPVLVNTSFNVRGEPIVSSPEDAFVCFMNTGMDYLLLGNFLLSKKLQPEALIMRHLKNLVEID